MTLVALFVISIPIMLLFSDKLIEYFIPNIELNKLSEEYEKIFVHEDNIDNPS